MADWNWSDSRENSSSDEKFLSPKNILGLPANIRAFIKVVILKNTEILEY